VDTLNNSTGRVFFGYAIPAVLGMVAISSASIIDGLFVGNYVGSDGLAAINISLPIFSFLFGISLMLSVGGSVISGKLIAEGNTNLASMIFTKTFISISIFAIIVCFSIYVNIEIILNLLGADRQLVDIATKYLSVIILFLPFLMVGIALDYFTRVDSRPVFAFTALLISAVTNIVLDWYMIVYLQKGIFGAALATGISQLVLFVILLPHFFSKKATLKFVKPTKGWMEIIKSAKNGASEFVNESSVGITTMIFNLVMIQHFGTHGVAAFSVINYILWVGVMISFGISDSLQPIISKNFGAKQPKRIMEFLKLSFMSVGVVGFFMIFLIIYSPDALADLFLEGSDMQTKKIVLNFAMFVWPVFLFNGVNLIISAYFTAIHKPVQSAVIAITRSLIFPALFIFTLPMFFTQKSIFMALPIAEVCTFLIAIYFFRTNMPDKVLMQKVKG